MAIFHDIGARLMQAFIAPRITVVPKSLCFTSIPRRVHVIHVPTRHGPARVDVYAPPNPTSTTAVHLNFHGGGYVMGHLQQDDPFCAFLADQAGVYVLNIDYVLAPQFRYPAAVQQAFELANWAATSGEEGGWDGTRMTVGGQSAGGGLAAALCLLAADGGIPPIERQILHYPPLDLVTDPADKKGRAAKPLIPPALARLFNAAYTPDAALRSEAGASPLIGATDLQLQRVAPAVVITAELDVLRDEASAYAQRLAKAGCLIEHIDIAGVDHGYNLRDAAPDMVAQVYRRIADHVRATWAY
ncbi:alpha/beta hydrolase fold domain-containing protein [Sphingobium sp. Ant17]|uniref:alpha/beta hydrolase fold domain-containing protein n=1 Tax=Sphingobium sp. Ant17 TaxID=1461752 RepID=UPI00190F8049|nr:alpha/beta hydrolase fold domain-containing protein [Sphingobium sp. Ant17]